MSVVEEVRERLDIVGVIGEYVQLKKSGRSYKGLCPFHSEKTPSFVVFPESGTWRCFGACSTGGDIYSFVMQIENLDFRAALELLARRAGVEIEPPSPQAEARKAHRERLREAVAAAAQHFHRQLLRAPEAAPARDYLKGRGFGGDIARAFALGWAQDSWSALGDALREDGFDDEELLAVGLVRERDAGGVYDYFRGRLVFPIHDRRGRPVAFGARTLDPEGVPKYLNSPKTELFDKGKVLYGLHRAARAAREAGEVVVVEGYTDVLRAHQAGFENVVATLGTAITPDHLTALKRYAPVVVLALDADAAGRQSTERGLALAWEAVAGKVAPRPTARGIRYEPQLELQLRVAALPEGTDPDDVIREAPERWRRLVAGARPVLEYLFDARLEGLDLDDPRDKTEAANRLMPLVTAIPDRVERAAWVARLADLIGIDERTLATRLLQPRGRPSRAPQSQPPPDAPPAPDDRPPTEDVPDDLVTQLLGQLLLKPKRLGALNTALTADGQPPFRPAELPRAVDRELLQALVYAARGAAPPDAPAAHDLARLPQESARYAEVLAERASAEPAADEEVRLRELRARVLRLRQRARRQTLRELRELQADAAAEERADYDRQIYELGAELMTLEQLLTRPQLSSATTTGSSS